MQSCMNVQLLSISFSRKKKWHANYIKKVRIKKVTSVGQSVNMKKEEKFKFRCVFLCLYIQYIYKMENSVDVPRNMLFNISLCTEML